MLLLKGNPKETTMLSNLDMLSNATLIAIIMDQAKTLEKAIVDQASAQSDADDYYMQVTDLRVSNRDMQETIFFLKEEVARLTNKYEPKMSAKDALEKVAVAFPYDARNKGKISMIKLFRDLTGAGLKEAKDAIENTFYDTVRDEKGLYVSSKLKPVPQCDCDNCTCSE
jgi:ribosomal protein L7/L12